MPLSSRVHYNVADDLVELDLSNLTLTTEILDNFLYQLTKAAQNLDHQTYGLINWQNTKLPIELADYYGNISATALTHYLAFVRYGVDDVIANATVRSQVVRRGVQGSRSHIYPTREAALHAIHELRQATTTKATSTLTPSSSTRLTTPSATASITERDLESFYDSTFATIYWNTRLSCVQTHWKGFAEGTSLRETMAKGLELLQSKKSALWLADLRKLGVIGQADQEWISQEWFPRAIKVGLRKRVVVLPEKTIGRMAVTRIVEKINNVELETASFKELEEAYQWLQH